MTPRSSLNFFRVVKNSYFSILVPESHWRDTMHWTDEDLARLEEVSTFEEAAGLAIEMLARLSETGKEIVQICGPMSTGGLGSLEANMERFRLAIERAHERGLVVFNQIPFQKVIIRLCRFEEGQSDYNWEILEIFYRRIFESGYVGRTLFIEDWDSSTGATWERRTVTKLGLIVEEYPMEWLG